PPVQPSSGEFELPPTPSRPVSLPQGITETTSNIPSAAERDTDPVAEKPDWRRKPAPAPTTGGRGKTAAIAAGILVLFAGAGGGVYYFAFMGGPPKPPNDTKPEVVQTGDKEKERIEKLREDAAKSVTGLLRES